MHYKECLIKIIYFFEGLFSKKDAVCPYCLAKNFEIVHTKAYVVNICRCLQCGLYWTNPIFRFYKIYDTLYTGKWPSGIEIPESRQIRGLLNSNFNGTYKNYSCFIEWLEKNVKGRKLIEFGSSWGYFLYQAKKAQFDATGVEISKERRTYGIEKLNVKIMPDLETLIAKRERYDIIVSFHTIEHLTLINNIFQNFNILLNEGGSLVILVPFINIELGKKAFSIIGAVHPLGFCKDFFASNMPKEGFKVDFYNGLVICTKVSDRLNQM